MKTIKGPAIFLAQFAGDAAPYNTLDGMAGWAAGHGYAGIQIPSWDQRLFDLERAAESQAYCDEVKGVAARHGLAITELSTHLQGQLIASHPAFDALLDGFAPAELAGDAKAKAEWAEQQLRWAAKASSNLGLSAHATFSGALAWPFFYPWPQRSAGLIAEAFAELGRRWTPILNAFDEAGVDALHSATFLADEMVVVSVVNKFVAPFVVAKIAAPDQVELLERGHTSVNRHSIARPPMQALADLVDGKRPVAAGEQLQHQPSRFRYAQPAPAQCRQRGLVKLARTRLAVSPHDRFLYAASRGPATVK